MTFITPSGLERKENSTTRGLGETNGRLGEAGSRTPHGLLRIMGSDQISAGNRTSNRLLHAILHGSDQLVHELGEFSHSVLYGMPKDPPGKSPGSAQSNKGEEGGEKG